MGNLLVDRPAEHVLRILIDRPEKRNAVDFETRESLIEAFSTGFADPQTRAVVFGGSGGNFSAGGDLPSMVGMTREEAVSRMRHGHVLCRLVAETGIPIVTAAEGIVAGACLGLALLGDFIIAGPGTKIMLPFLKLGLVPDWGLLRSLPLRLGLPLARRLILESRTIRGEEAERIGLADWYVNDTDIMAESLAKATELARLPRHALALVKSRWREAASDFSEDLAREEADQVACFLRDEFREGFAAFCEKREPDYTGL